MTPIQTYGGRGRFGDPYAVMGERPGRNRSGLRAFGLRFHDLETPAAVASPVNVTAALTTGSLSSITIFISHSRREHVQGLTEMLQNLKSARIKADPYVEIDEAIRTLIGTGIEQRLAKVLGTPHLSKKRASLEELLGPALQLERHGRIDSALDALYDRVDDLLKTGEFEALNDMLQDARVGSLSTDVLLGVLTATLPARSKLPARAKFFHDAGAAIRGRGEWENGLLAGLES